MVFDQYNTANRPYAAWNYSTADKSWSVTQAVPSS